MYTILYYTYITYIYIHIYIHIYIFPYVALHPGELDSNPWFQAQIQRKQNARARVRWVIRSGID